MREKRSKGKQFKKTILAATMIIGASTMIFQGLTQAAAAAEYNKTDTIPTSYVNVDASSSKELPEGYEKANYSIKWIKPYYENIENKTPSEKDLTKEEAAELAAQYLWQAYGVNLEGQTIEMHWRDDGLPMWDAQVKMEGQDYHDGYRVDGYSVRIDSVTGDLLHVYMNRTLEEKVNADSIDKDESKYEPTAKELAEKYDVVHGDIEAINCVGQAYDSIEGDVLISFKIQGKNGEVAFITFSQYDGVLEQIEYNDHYKFNLLMSEKSREEMKAESEARSAQRAAAAANGSN